MWLAGIAISLIFTLIGAIWKTNQKVNDDHKTRLEELDSSVNHISQVLVENKSAIESIKDTCNQRKQTTVGEVHIRSIFREELKEFERRMKSEITNSIKLSLLEDGYIKPSQQRKRNVAKA